MKRSENKNETKTTRMKIKMIIFLEMIYLTVFLRIST